MTGGPMTRALSGRSLRLLLALLALVEAHFIADSLATLIEVVVGNGGTVWDLALLLALASPEVIDFALPIAILIGLFFAITTAREENELVASAAAGVRWTRIPWFALRLGVLGFLVSLLFAGFLTPSAKYAQRLAIHVMETRRVLEEMQNPSSNSAIRQIRDRTIVATPPEDSTAERGNLLIFEPDSGLGWRVSQARDWTVEGPGENGEYSVRLSRFKDYRERPDPSDDDGSLAQRLQFARVNVQNLAVDFRLEEVIRALDRTRARHEQMLVALPALAGLAGASEIATVDRRFGEVMARALVCVFAAMAAVAAASWSGTRSGRWLALPVGVVAVPGIDVAARTLLGDAGAAGPATFWPAFAMAAALAVALPGAYVAWRGEAIITPRRGQA